MSEQQQTAIGFYAGRIQQLAAELQGLGYNLAHMHSNLSSPVPQWLTASELLSVAGSVARVQVQLNHVLDQVRELCLAGERRIGGQDKQ